MARWTDAEVEQLESLWIGSLGDVPRDPTNRVADDPRAAALGRSLFFETRLSANGGPLFTNNEFHNTGVPAVPTLPADRGRLAGSTQVLNDEFNCRSQWSDARDACRELEFMVVASHDHERAFKVPSLRNVADRAPYMHAGQLASLADVLTHYNRAAAAAVGHTELKPLKLRARELRQLEAFLRTLSGGTTQEEMIPEQRLSSRRSSSSLHARNANKGFLNALRVSQ